MFRGETAPGSNRGTGKEGETTAEDFLVKQGWKVLARNYRKKWGEIDIVAKAPDKTLVFVEVKTLRQSGNPASDLLIPEDNLTQAKLSKLKRICQGFANERKELVHETRGWRIDLVAVLLGIDGPRIRHYENVSRT